MNVFSLPPELHLDIAESLGNDYASLARLHQTSKYFKELLDPLLSTKGLLVAHKVPHTYIRNLKRFISSGACVNAPVSDKREYCGWIPSSERSLDFAVHTENLVAVKLLLDAGADINARAKCCGDAPLHRAVKRSYSGGVSLDVVILLLERGADINLPSGNFSGGKTVLHRAVLFKHARSMEVQEVLVKYGADINRKSVCWNKNTPLHVAMGYGREESVRFLLKNGADANVLNGLGMSPLFMAQVLRNVNLSYSLGAFAIVHERARELLLRKEDLLKEYGGKSIGQWAHFRRTGNTWADMELLFR